MKFQLFDGQVHILRDQYSQFLLVKTHVFWVGYSAAKNASSRIGSSISHDIILNYKPHGSLLDPIVLCLSNIAIETM